MKLVILQHEWDLAEFRLFRLLEWAGIEAGDYTLMTMKEGQARPVFPINSVVLALGPRAFEACGPETSLETARGYVHNLGNIKVIPTVSAKFIQGGNAKMSAAFINDAQKAAKLAKEGQPPIYLSYMLDPLPIQALQWADEYIAELQRNPATYLAFDIETPGKPDEDEDELELAGEKDQTWTIDRVGFSYKEHHAISFPFEPIYFAVIRRLLESNGPKVVWNAGFDVPRLRHAGFPINGVIHDGMIAWHILHSDLPKKLRFVATFTCPWQPAWKHLSHARPAFYNATDADVELRCMLKIEQDLRETGLWEVYERDVLDLEPVLEHMSLQGMPLDSSVRERCAVELASELLRLSEYMTSCVPMEARRIGHVYKRKPNDTIGLLSRPTILEVSRCAACGLERPGKAHFKLFKKKLNKCGGAELLLCREEGQEYFRLDPFTPSKDQLIRYHQHLARPLPMVYDKKAKKKKPSFAEKQLKQLLLKYPTDQLYQTILDYRSIDKLAGTYVGRPVE